MTKPALVIGLGGTGQWALTYLKKDLIEANNGHLPENVRLLAFDTVVEAGAKAMGRTQEKEARVGTIALERDVEFIHLGGALEKEVQAVADGELPYVGSWFRAKDWLRLPSGTLGLSYGSGQLRQLSRFALFMDLTQPNLSKVWSSMKKALEAIERTLRRGDQLTINIISSLAGGTGSGLLIDFALLAQHYARDVKGFNVQVRGYLVLPRAFTSTPDKDMQARAFAVWRELNRLMAVRNDFALPTVVYNSMDSTLQIREFGRALFDACYMVDGVRAGADLSAKAEYGVHAIVAEAIAATLDDRSGQRYMEYVANVAREYVKKPGVPFYGALGAYSFKVPIYYAQQKFVNNLTVSWLEALLKPVRGDPTNPQRITWVDPTSPNDPSIVGADEINLVLQRQQEFQGQTEAPTIFLNALVDIREKGGATNTDLVRAYALGANKGQTWLDVFTNLGERQDIAELVARVRAEARLRLDSAVKPSKVIKENPRDFPRRAQRDVPAFHKQRYGFRTATGEENRGKFGEALDECGAAQLDIFRRQVQLWLLNSLNGGKKRGRLGYAYSLVDGLVKFLDEFVMENTGFLARVDSKRQEENPGVQVANARAAAEREMQRYAPKKWPAVLPFWDHPKSHSSQVSYLQAEQRVNDVRKDELLHGSVLGTLRQMRAYCIEVRQELARWIHTLLMGDSSTGIQGLYSLLRKQGAEIDQNRSEDKKLDAVQSYVGDLESWMEEQQKKEQEEHLERLMSGVTWRIAEKSGGFCLDLHIEPAGEPAHVLEQPSGRETSERLANLTQRNLHTFQEYAARRFSYLPEQTKVAELLAKGTPKDFAEDLGEYQAPLFERAPGYPSGPVVWSEFLCANQDNLSETAHDFLHELERRRRDLRQQDVEKANLTALVELEDSENPYKFTMLVTHDMYPAEAFNAWKQYQTEYRTNTELPPHLNHNFQAEVNAAEWEVKLARRWEQEYRIFHPWVVMLLEQPHRVQQFLMCWALGWIPLRDDGALKWYELDVPGMTQRHRQSFFLTPQRIGNEPVKWQPSIFQVARAFVLVGRDQAEKSQRTLNEEEIDRALLDAERKRTPEEWVAFLESLLGKSDSEKPEEWQVVRWLHYLKDDLEKKLREEGSLPRGEPADYGTAYTDLADLAELMIEEQLKQKRLDIEKKTR